MGFGRFPQNALPRYETDDSEEDEDLDVGPPSAPRQQPLVSRPRCPGLAEDRRCGERIERRRWDCAALPSGESAWVIARGIDQARCPDACAGYVPLGG